MRASSISRCSIGERMPVIPMKTGLAGISPTLLLVVAIAVVAVMIYTTSNFPRDERVIADFCRESAIGESLEQAGARAMSRELSSKNGEATGPAGASLTISSEGPLWSGASFCSLYHDGKRITAVSYNLWYH